MWFAVDYGVSWSQVPGLLKCSDCCTLVAQYWLVHKPARSSA